MSIEKDKSVVAKNATAEERAREYAVGMLNQYENVIDKTSMTFQLFSANELMDAYLEAHSSRDTEVAELREVLKEIVDRYGDCYFSNTTSTKRDFNDMFEESITKAKQLLEDE